MKYMRAPAKDRFERLYIPEPNSGCWLWLGTTTSDGYGRFRTGGSVVLAHRFSYTMLCAEIPHGKQVLHRCDNPSCVNPYHLFLGTITDNMRDMAAKGRGKSVKGCAHHRAKLSPEKAFEIRWLSAIGRSRNSLARDYGVTKPHIKAIDQHKIWRMEAHD